MAVRWFLRFVLDTTKLYIPFSFGRIAFVNPVQLQYLLHVQHQLLSRVVLESRVHNREIRIMTTGIRAHQKL